MTTILQQAGLGALAASDSGTAIKILNCVMTIVAVLLVERKGRTFLLEDRDIRHHHFFGRTGGSVLQRGIKTPEV